MEKGNIIDKISNFVESIRISETNRPSTSGEGRGRKHYRQRMMKDICNEIHPVHHLPEGHRT